jgi:hypothetical protein
MLRWFGEHCLIEGDFTGARLSYGKAISVLEPIAAADPNNAELVFDLASSRAELGSTLELLDDQKVWTRAAGERGGDAGSRSRP